MKIGRSAVSGRFTSVGQAIRKPNTHVVETIKPSNSGSQGKGKGK